MRRLARAPFWCPPMPSATAQSPCSGMDRRASSLFCRTLPTSVRAALRQETVVIRPALQGCRQPEAAQQMDVEGVRGTLSVKQVVHGHPIELRLEQQHVTPAVVIHLHRVEQAEHRPGARVFLDAYAPTADFLNHQTGTTVIFLAGPAERRLNDGAMAILHLLVTESEISTAQMRIQ